MHGFCFICIFRMTLINKIKDSGLIVIDLEDYSPNIEDIIELDISIFLFKGLILKEVEFRTALKSYDWNIFSNKYVAIFCSTDAIIPSWAYMLMVMYLNKQPTGVFFGNKFDVLNQITLEKIAKIDANLFLNEKVIIKGCGKLNLSPSAYIEISNKLLTKVKSLMFGEPCSTVPIYKRK
jgi:hypothetical protein